MFRILIFGILKRFTWFQHYFMSFQYSFVENSYSFVDYSILIMRYFQAGTYRNLLLNSSLNVTKMTLFLDTSS